MITKLSYRDALRLMLFGVAPPHDFDITVFAYDPHALGMPGEWPWRHLSGSAASGRDGVALHILTESLEGAICAMWPPERAFLVGARVPGADGLMHVLPIDPTLRVRADETHELRGDQIVSMRGGRERALTVDETFSLFLEWTAHSVARVQNLRRIWVADMAEEGPHQPWARERARFLHSLLVDRGVRPPMLALLPQWHLQWWYDATGYEQVHPSDPPRPVRCWHFPSVDGRPVVCGQPLPCPVHGGETAAQLKAATDTIRRRVIHEEGLRVRLRVNGDGTYSPINQDGKVITEDEAAALVALARVRERAATVPAAPDGRCANTAGPMATREQLLALLADVRTLLDGTGRDDITERIDLVFRDENEGASE